METTEDVQTCPFCAETIKAAAVVCRYCGRNLLEKEEDRRVPVAENAGGAKDNLPNQVTVTDIHMPFLSMVIIMVKWTVAAIPTLIILAILTVLAFTLLSASLIPILRLLMGV